MQETLSQLVARRLKELDFSKADLAAATRLSRTYITDIANGTGNTQSGQYRPSPEVVSRLSEVLKVPESDILAAIGYQRQNPGESHDILDGVKIIFADGKGLSKKKQQEILEAARLVARGVMASGDEE